MYLYPMDVHYSLQTLYTTQEADDMHVNEITCRSTGIYHERVDKQRQLMFGKRIPQFVPLNMWQTITEITSVSMEIDQ